MLYREKPDNAWATCLWLHILPFTRIASATDQVLNAENQKQVQPQSRVQCSFSHHFVTFCNLFIANLRTKQRRQKKHLPLLRGFQHPLRVAVAIQVISNGLKGRAILTNSREVLPMVREGLDDGSCMEKAFEMRKLSTKSPGQGQKHAWRSVCGS